MSAHFIEWYAEVVLPLAAATAVIASSVWYILFAATLGFDPPRLALLLRRWFGALALCGFALIAVPVLTQRFVTTLDLALLPLASAGAYTIRWCRTRQPVLLETDE